MKNQAEIIYFIAGRHATPDEIAEAQALPAKVRYLSATVIDERHIPQECDGVCGEVPKCYAEYPSAKDAIKAKAKEVEAKFAKSKDVKAPSKRKSKVKSKAKSKDKKKDETPESTEGDVAETSDENAPAWGGKKATEEG